MPLAGVAAGSWFFWDGRKDSLWSQALGPLESAVEHGGDRLQYVRVIATHHRAEYEAVFGPLPDFSNLPEHATPNGRADLREAWQSLPENQRDEINRVFANLGKAIAAYERKLQPGESRFDRYVDAIESGDTAATNRILDREEVAGLRLFIGKARCTECHNGPLLTNHDFANTGVPEAKGLPGDLGREGGARQVLQDEFNCNSPYSDASPETCRELAALKPQEHMLRQFKVPSLRNVAERAPYMHAGQFASLPDVLAHYNRAPAAPAGKTQLHPLNLDNRELTQLDRFLQTLSAPLDTASEWLAPPSTSNFDASLAP
jgi:cytochrome c peroxidase